MAYSSYNNDEGLFAQIFGELFTKEEWDLWAKGEFSLFDNYVKRVGMNEEDADRLRNRVCNPLSGGSKKMTPYQEFLENPLDMSEVLGYDSKTIKKEL
jgi:hypothetical protein|tara:strand:- start:362 stop:655 length:294 start_codon:yes stop_codon:yes gene_type:complete